ncbi:Transmembrane protein 18 [Zostera marina]|uniref:Transmembrane protein 18 n=1 Tax=Zostera marina TaxID=29655 RepID=A0A0K9PR47_ZOSMR|nr:Transmembrane protein 18 [Zostera marina]
MEELRSTLNEHIDVVSEIFDNFSTGIRSGFQPAYVNFLGFFHAIDWKEPWLIGLLSFHFLLLLTVIFSRKNVNFQAFLSFFSFSAVYLAERINRFLGVRWKMFARQNYFDSHGLFISTLWSGPLLIILMIIVVNTLVTSCKLIIQWKRAELRHRAKLTRNKED